MFDDHVNKDVEYLFGENKNLVVLNNYILVET